MELADDGFRFSGHADAMACRNGRVRLLVRAPCTYVPERRYVLDVVLSEWLGLEYDLCFGTETQVTLQVAGDERGGEITLPDVLFSTPPESWLTERSMSVSPLARMRIQPSPHADVGTARLASDRSLGDVIPVLFGDPSPQQGVWCEKKTTGLALSVDVFGSVFFLLTRYEELVGRVRDQHDRFPAGASLAAVEGFLDRPLADEYVDVLWTAMHSLWPGLERRSSALRLRLTHDVDEFWAAHGRRVPTVARAVAGDLLRRHDLDLATRRSRSLLEAWAGQVERDPYNTFDFLMDTSERHGLRSTFYVMAGSTLPEFDGHYSLSDPPVARLLQRIHDRGHEIGLHASYGTYRSGERIRGEFDALRAACAAIGIDQPTWGVRQHYLRFENPLTWRIQESAGFEHDSTLGFADQVGFRAGTCREYPLFDLLDHRKLALRERPLLVMDGTLFNYLALDSDDAAVRTRSIVDACRRQRGDAVLLFHNSSLAGARWRAFYGDLVEDLVRSSQRGGSCSVDRDHGAAG